MLKPTRYNALALLFVLTNCFCHQASDLYSQTLNPEWTSISNGAGDFSDRFTCVLQESSGNYIAAGSSVRRSDNKDFLVVKFNSAGDTLWSFTLDGGFGGPDEIVSMALDNAGNIYASGYMKGYYTGYDIKTLKLNSNGDTVWTKRYNYASANEDDIPTSVAIDNSGNLYVAGYSDSDPSALVANDDALMLKYGSNGSLIWSQRYNGTFNGVDRFAKVVVNSAGEIYTGGRTENIDDDFLLIKYSSAGSQTWLQAYDGGSFDRITCMQLDASGNCVVSGRSSNGTDHDLVTIKYSSTGQTLFTALYDYIGDDRATALAIDATGNIYVTGQSDGDASVNKIFDYVTIKYSSSLVQQWATRFAGSAGGDDIPQAIAVSGTGEVWVTGISDAATGAPVINNCVTLKYSSTGTQALNLSEGLQTGEDGGLNILLDDAGKAVVCGYFANASNQADATLFRYTTTGTKEFDRTYNGQGDNQDVINAITKTSDGFIVSVGYSVEKDLDPNMLFIKTNAAGTEIWRKTLSGNSTTGSTDNATAVVADAAGNIYATGYTKNSNAGSDFTTVKLNAAGDTVWTRKYSFQTGSSDRAVAMAFDPQGNIVVTGYSDNDPSPATNYDFATIKYSPAGAQLWAVRYNSTLNSDDKPIALLINAAGDVLITGRAFNGLNDDILTVKYNAAGIFQWVNLFAGTSGDDRNTAMIADGSNNLYITGRTFNGSDLDALLIKVSSSGQAIWNRTFNNAGISDDRFNDLVFDTSGNIIAVGQADIDVTATNQLNTLIISYTPDGTEQWNQLIALPNVFQNSTSVVARSSIDDLFLGGLAMDNLGNSAPLTMKVDPAAGLIGFGTPTLGANTHGEIHDILLDANFIYTAGEYETNSTSMSDGFLVKYSDNITGLEYLSEDQISVYPNPSEDYCYIRSAQGTNITSVKMMDATGRTIISQSEISGTSIQRLNTANLPSGMYFLEIGYAGTFSVQPIIIK